MPGRVGRDRGAQAHGRTRLPGFRMIAGQVTFVNKKPSVSIGGLLGRQPRQSTTILNFLASVKASELKGPAAPRSLLSNMNYEAALTQNLPLSTWPRWRR